MRLSHSRLPRIDRFLHAAAAPRTPAIAAIAATLAGVFLLDRHTGAAPVQHLFYLPLIFAAMRFGAAAGLATSVGAILLYHVGNDNLLHLRHTQTDIFQIAVFVVVPLVAARMASYSRRLRALAATDDLTGLANLRGFEPRLEAMLASGWRRCRPVSMIVVDLDRLKLLNDSFGHLAGADAVRTVGRMIGEMLPEDAAACRYGGDEFAIALHGSSEEALAFAERLRSHVHALAPVLDGRPMPRGVLSISAGAATRDFEAAQDLPLTPEEEGRALFLAADEALYRAKQGGRDRVAGGVPR